MGRGSRSLLSHRGSLSASSSTAARMRPLEPTRSFGTADGSRRGSDAQDSVHAMIVTTVTSSPGIGRNTIVESTTDAGVEIKNVTTQWETVTRIGVSTYSPAMI